VAVLTQGSRSTEAWRRTCASDRGPSACSHFPPTWTMASLARHSHCSWMCVKPVVVIITCPTSEFTPAALVPTRWRDGGEQVEWHRWQQLGVPTSAVRIARTADSFDSVAEAAAMVALRRSNIPTVPSTTEQAATEGALL
jgi:hypothetical protein